MDETLEYKERIKAEDWKMTDPNSHNPENFRYIVYAMHDPRDIPYPNPNVNADDLIHDVYKPGGVGRLINRDILSTSVIDPAHTRTFGACGLILDVPPKSIVSASPQDGGSVEYPETYQTLINYKPDLKNRAVPPASAILTETGKHIHPYNEVIIHPTNPNNGDKIKVTGAFIAIDSETKQPVNAQLATETRELANSLGIPVVEIIQRL